jgi:hypothetical protein
MRWTTRERNGLRRACELVLAACALTLAACAGAVKDAARTAAPPVLDATLDSARRPEAKARLQAVMTDPDVQIAIREFGRALTEGVLARVDEPQRQALIQAATDRLIGHVARSVGRVADRALDPAMTRVVGAATQAVTREIVGRLGNGDDVARVAYAVTEGAALGLDGGMATGLRDDLGPAFEAFLRDHVARGLQGALGPDTNRALGGTAREVGRQLVIGLDEGLREIDGSGRSLVQHATLAGPERPWPTIVAAALGVLVLVLVAWIVALRRRRDEARSDERLATAIARGVQEVMRAEPAYVDDLARRLVTELRTRVGVTSDGRPRTSRPTGDATDARSRPSLA